MEKMPCTLNCRRVCISFLISALLLQIAQATNVKVSVYYEALCPDSVNFITQQLAPTYAKLGQYIEVDLVPFGKAIYIHENNKYRFTCQHGEAECRGNKYQACALNQGKDADKNVAFVACVMGKRSPANPQNIQTCSEADGMNWSEMSSCARGTEGDRLLAQMGDKTHNLEISLAFVPTIVINDVYNQTLQDASLVDFLAVVCSKIEGEAEGADGKNTKPDVCRDKVFPSLAKRRRSFWGSLGF